MESFFRMGFIPIYPISFWPPPISHHAKTIQRVLNYLKIIFMSQLAMGECAEAIQHFDDIVLLIDSAITSLTATFATLKYVTFIMDPEFLKSLVETISALCEKSPIKDDNDKVIKRIHELWKKRTHLFIKLSLCTYSFVFFFYFGFAWLKGFQYKDWTPPIPSKYPFAVDTPLLYVLISILQFCSSQVTVWVYVATESFFGALVLFICSRLEMLQYCYEIAAKQATETRKTPLLFKTSTEYHKTLLRLCDMIERLYSPTLLMQFFYSTVMLCIICFITTQDVGPERQMVFAFYLTSVMCQLFIYCFFGQFLQNKFENLCNDIFHCEWYNAAVSYQQDIKFLLLRCNSPVIITAYKIMPVNLESFFSIVKTALSYFTVLQSMSESED